MQSVVTGQAPTTLERKTTAVGKTNKYIKQKIVHTITETNSTPLKQIVCLRADKKQKGEISVRTYVSRYISYAKRVAAETETEETA